MYHPGAAGIHTQAGVAGGVLSSLGAPQVQVVYAGSEDQVDVVWRQRLLPSTLAENIMTEEGGGGGGESNMQN